VWQVGKASPSPQKQGEGEGRGLFIGGLPGPWTGVLACAQVERGFTLKGAERLAPWTLVKGTELR